MSKGIGKEPRRTGIGIGQSVIRGLDTAGKWSSASSAIYGRGSNLSFAVINKSQVAEPFGQTQSLPDTFGQGRGNRNGAKRCFCFRGKLSVFFCHHPPDKTGELSGDSGFGDVAV